jgi:plastocyanin
MKRLALVLVSVVAGVCALPASAGSDAFSFVQVTEKEYTLTLSRQSVRAGSVSVELVNFGMDTHDLMVKGAKAGSKTFRFKQLDPRGRTERTLRLTPGRYALWCSLGNHKARGMKATLVVRK